MFLCTGAVFRVEAALLTVWVVFLFFPVLSMFFDFLNTSLYSKFPPKSLCPKEWWLLFASWSDLGEKMGGEFQSLDRSSYWLKACGGLHPSPPYLLFLSRTPEASYNLHSTFKEAKSGEPVSSENDWFPKLSNMILTVFIARICSFSQNSTSKGFSSDTPKNVFSHNRLPCSLI